MLDSNSVARFEAKIDRSGGCWLWTASRTPSGYGQFFVDGRIIGAHRVAYTLYVGPIEPGLHVLHRCDVPACVNPAHLFAGSAADNLRDMTRKERHGRMVLTAEAVRQIRRTSRPLRELSLIHI